MNHSGLASSGVLVAGTGSANSFDQLDSPSARTTSRAVASEISTALSRVLPNTLRQGRESRSRPISSKGLPLNPGGCAIAIPPMSTEGRGRNPMRRLFDRRRQAGRLA